MAALFTSGMPAATLPLTGVETIPLDTNTTGGAAPSQVAPTTAQLKQFIFGNAARTDGTAVAGAVTVTGGSGKITSEALSTAAGATYTLTVTDTNVAAADIILGSVALGTATTGTPAITTIKPAAGSFVVIVQNIHASAALNGTIVVSFMQVK